MTGKIYLNFAYKTQKGRSRGDIPDKLIYKRLLLLEKLSQELMIWKNSYILDEDSLSTDRSS